MPAAAFYDLVVETLKGLGKGKSWLSQRSGVSRNTLDNWQRQPRPPQAGTVIAVADVLGIEHQTALRLAGVAPDFAPPGVPLTNLEEVSTDVLVDGLRRIGDELRRRIPD